jgi:enoyl-[acyl-carrier-protein] reductase (NADH)
MPGMKDFNEIPTARKRVIEISAGALLTVATLGLFALKRAMIAHRKQRIQNAIGWGLIAVSVAAVAIFLGLKYL